MECRSKWVIRMVFGFGFWICLGFWMAYCIVLLYCMYVLAWSDWERGQGGIGKERRGDGWMDGWMERASWRVDPHEMVLVWGMRSMVRSKWQTHTEYIM